MMEDQKMSAPRKFVFCQSRINRGFKNEDSHLQSSSMDSDTETYSDSDLNGGTVLTCATSDSPDLHFLRWAKTAKRGRKSLSTSPSTSTLSCSSLSSREKQVEPVSGDEKQVEPLSGDEKEAADTQFPLADRCSDDSSVSSINVSEKDKIAEFPDSGKKRKPEDTDIDCTKDGAGIEKETKNSRDEIIFGILNLDGTHKQRPKYSCDICGKAFSSFQALGGHRSSCKKINEVGGSTKTTKDKEYASSSVHQYRCKTCFKSFASGQALGGHQKSHPQVKPQIGSLLSLSAPNEEVRKESLSRNYCLTSSVQEAQDEVTNKKRKVMLFGVDLSENLPEGVWLNPLI